jgi:hypothetical protein
MKCDFAKPATVGIVAAEFPDESSRRIEAMRLPTEAEIAAINARHLIETPLRPADLLFVFGTREDVDARRGETRPGDIGEALDFIHMGFQQLL